MDAIERIGDIVCSVGESPLWSVAEQAWYWVDIVGRRVWRMDGGDALRHWSTPEMVGCIALREGGGLVAGMETGLFALTLDEGEQAVATRLVCPPELGPGMRFNDGRCDRQGRFWSGTMCLDMAAARADGHLYRYASGQGISASVVSGLIVQNGLAFAPDGRTMYLSDSHASSRRVWAFDYDIETGVPSGRRLFADLHQHVGRPDGAAVDTDGCYWICANDAGCVLRFTPEGTLDRRIDLPMAKPSMCSFGGADLSTLLVTSIAAGAPAHDGMAGAVVALRPGAQGLAEVHCA